LEVIAVIIVDVAIPLANSTEDADIPVVAAAFADAVVAAAAGSGKKT
jgi:hypothetical protein